MEKPSGLKNTQYDPTQGDCQKLPASKVIRVARWHATFFTNATCCVPRDLWQKSCVPPENAQVARNFSQAYPRMLLNQEGNFKTRKRGSDRIPRLRVGLV